METSIITYVVPSKAPAFLLLNNSVARSYYSLIADTGQAVPRLELEESGGEVVVGLDDRGVRFLPVTGSVFAVSCTAQHFPCPALGVLPLLL